VTMQPRNLLDVAAPLELVLPPEVGLELGDGEDEPHAARSRAATAEAATTLNDILNAYLLRRGQQQAATRRPAQPAAPAGWSSMTSPHGIARRVALQGHPRKE
jgi:hypothetical protein